MLGRCEDEVFVGTRARRELLKPEGGNMLVFLGAASTVFDPLGTVAVDLCVLSAVDAFCLARSFMGGGSCLLPLG